MVTFKQLLHAFSTSLHEASASTDALSADYAEKYYDSGRLKYREAPYFNISEVEFDFPVTIENLELSERSTLNFSKAEYNLFLRSTISDWFKENIDGISSSLPNKEIVVAPVPEVDVTYNKLIDSYEKDISIEQLDRIMDKESKGLINKIIKHNDLMDIYQQKDPEEKLLRTAVSNQFKARIKSFIKIKKDDLKEVLINPITQAVKGINSDQSIFRVRVKMNGGGVMLSESIDSNGKSTRALM